MKNRLKMVLSIGGFVACIGILQAQVKIGNNPNTINASAILEMEATNKGVLITRIALTATTDAATISSPATSLLIYNTATAGTAPNNVLPGYYYWNGTKWISMQAAGGGVLSYAKFYALMPTNNSATIAVGSAILFPNVGASSNSEITAISNSTFQLAAIGTYQIMWQVSINEPGQLLLKVNGTEDLTTVVGRATGTSQLTGTEILTTTAINTVISIVNPTGNSTALTITPYAGGTKPVAATLIITRIQ